MSISIIETPVECTECHEKLCNICGFNGACENCGHPIDAATDKKLRDAIQAVVEEKGQ